MKNINNKNYLIILLLIISLLLCSCSFIKDLDIESIFQSNVRQYNDNNNINNQEENIEYKEYPNIDNMPKFSGDSFSLVNDGVPYFSNDEKLNTKTFEYYSELDSLGRCGVAFANLSKETMPTESRGDIGMIKPSGWMINGKSNNNKYDFIDGKYIYNRCHLIGFQLAGENANEKNLITGTRYLNTNGMLPFENMVADYIKETNNHVLYRVTPLYKEDNLVASGVQIEAWSVEDKGQGICINVMCYNVQPNVYINYLNGYNELVK